LIIIDVLQSLLDIKFINAPKRNRPIKEEKRLETEKFKLKDIGYGLILPIIVALIIVAFPAVLRPFLDGIFPPGDPNAFVTVILTHGFAQMVVFAIPLILGLVWNKWAGGAAGFITGGMYYLAYAGYFGIPPDYNFYRDPSFIGNYLVCGVIIGYIAGSLNNGSFNFKRMLGAGLTAAITVGILQFFFNYYVALYGANLMTQSDPAYSLFLTMLPNIILGFIAPVVAKVMTWYGAYPMRH
jgi:hypothetical protein